MIAMAAMKIMYKRKGLSSTYCFREYLPLVLFKLYNFRAYSKHGHNIAS